jgi:hypothetical protein
MMNVGAAIDNAGNLAGGSNKGVPTDDLGMITQYDENGVAHRVSV